MSPPSVSMPPGAVRATGSRVRVGIRSTEAVAVAGVAYSLLTFVALALLARSPSLELSDTELTEWYADADHRSWLIVALNLASVSVVAFLWFVAVIRRRLGRHEDQFFATVFFGAGIVYAVVWVGAATAFATPAVALTMLGAGEVSGPSATFGAGFGAGLLLVVAPRVQAVFVLTTSTLVLRSRVLPGWLAVVGYVTGLVLFVVPLVMDPVGIVFPVWVLVVSFVVLAHRRPADGTASPDDAAGPDPSRVA